MPGRVCDYVLHDAGEPAQKAAGGPVGELVELHIGFEQCFLQDIIDFHEATQLRSQAVVCQDCQPASVGIQEQRERFFVSLVDPFYQVKARTRLIHIPFRRAQSPGCVLRA